MDAVLGADLPEAIGAGSNVVSLTAVLDEWAICYVGRHEVTIQLLS